MVAIAAPEDGMENALAKARALYSAADAALHSHRLDGKEAYALREIREHIGLLEGQVRAARLETDQTAKAELISGVDPLRRQVIDKCRKHQGSVQACQTLVTEILEWCELGPKDQGASPGTPKRRAAVAAAAAAALPSTDAAISGGASSTLGSSTPDVSSGWVKSRVAGLDVPGSAGGSPSPSSPLSLSAWDARPPSLRAIRTATPGGAGAGGSPVGYPKGSPTRHARSASLGGAAQHGHDLADRHQQADQSLTAAAAAAAAPPPHQQASGIYAVLEAARAQGARLSSRGSSGGLSSQRSASSGGLDAAAAAAPDSGGERESAEMRHQAEVWRLSLNQAQQLGRQSRAFLQMDRADTAVSSSLGSGQLPAYAGALLPSGYGSARARSDDDSGFADWDNVHSLRPAARLSSHGPYDLAGTLRGSSMLEAAILSSNASRVHVLYDAVPLKPLAEGGLLDVPAVPACLAVGRKRPWWAKALRTLAGSAVVAVALVAAAVSASVVFDSDAERSTAQQQQRQRQRPQKQQAPRPQRGQPQLQLPYVPIGPAPDAGAGCG